MDDRIFDYLYCHNPYFNRWFSAIRFKYGVTVLCNHVTILILIDGFLQFESKTLNTPCNMVTILILIDGFLQFKEREWLRWQMWCHNPYFNRWFSAIKYLDEKISDSEYGHNPYFNRWFSAMACAY